MRDPSGSAGRSESSQPAPNPAINDELQFSPVSITTSQSSTRHRQCQLVSRNMSLNRIVTLALLVLCSFFVGSTSAKSNEKRVVCYYTNWSAYRQGPAKFLPDNINPYLCTHLVYAFGGLTSDSGIKPFDKYQDIDKGGYTKFNGLKTYNKALKTLIAIGGWNEGSRRFSNLVSASESRKTFIKHAIRFLRQYHFDGLDLDWEYPASREGGVPEDKKNYALFIKELREAFEEESKSTGRARLLLTIAVPAGIEWITKGFDIPVINRNVDFFNLLTYDYHASTEPNANHHAPLKARSGLSEYDWKGQLNIEFTISHYLKEGAEPDKLVVGLPTYGRSYTLFNTDSHDVDAPSSGPGTKGKFTKEPGYLAYYEVCEGVKSGDWRVENGDSDVQGPHAVNGDQWVGYDDPRIMGVKGKWVKDNGLGGIMFWSVDNDDFRGTCHGKPFPLIESAKAAYYTGDAPGQSPQRPSSTSLTSRFSKPSTATSTSTNARNRFSNLSLANRRFTTPPPPSTTTGSSTKSSKGRRRNKNKKRNKKRNNRNKSRTTAEPTTTTTTSTTTTTPAPTFSPFNTPAPPTTPDPGVDFECKEDGFFPHPSVCKKYFWCLDAPGLGLVAHHFTCPAGLYFNKNTDSCDYARNVPCKPGVQATTTTTPTTTTSTTTTTRPTTRPTTTRTTTTTTTQAPEEEEDDEYYDDEEDDEGGEDTEEEEEEDEADEGDAATDNSGKSVKEINDIKDLLKLIKKLGGVEELEKFFEENPSIAAAAAEFEKQDKTKPKSKYTPSTSLNTRNRFTPTTTSSSTTSNSNRPRFGSSTNLKYTTITRNKNPQRPVDMTEEEADSDDSDDKPKTKSTTRTTTQTTSTPLRQKYVTLSRNSNASRNKNRDSSSSTPTPTPSPIPESTNSKLRQNSVASSSTETSVVVRYSNDDAFILPDSADSNGGDQVETDDDNVSKNRASLSSSVARLLSSNPPSSSSSSNKNSDNKSSNRYVTISRPYARVAGTVDGDTVVGDSTSNTGTLNAQNSRQRYVQLTRTRSNVAVTAAPKQEVKAVEVEEKKPVETDGDSAEEISAETQDDVGESSEEADDDEDGSIVEETGQPSETTPFVSTSISTSVSTSTTTEAATTTAAEEPSTSKPRLRIPTRKTNGLTTLSRTRSPSTSASTSRATSTFQTTLVTADDTAATTNTQDESTGSTRKARNFTVGNRRNLFSTRVRSQTSTPIPDAVSSQSSKDESSSVKGRENEVVSRATDPFQRALRTRSRTRFVEKSADHTEANSVTPSSQSDFSRSRSRSRFRSSTSSTTDNSIVDSTRPATTTTPILFRRRSRPTSTRPTTTSTTTTTTTTTTSTTTTPKPTTTTKKASANSSDKKDKNTSDEEDAEYYYYYYDEDEDTPSNGSNNGGATYDDLLDKSQTQRTTGLRTQDFATASSGAQIEKGFTKRNLHTRHGTSNVVNVNGNSDASPNTRVANANTKPKVETNRSSFTRSIDSSKYRSRKPQNNTSFSSSSIPTANPFDKIKAVGSGNEKSRQEAKWSARAVVPLSEKIRLRPDGSVQCLDKGIFPHPVSCRQFVHCAASEKNDGNIRSWVYACPKSLSFDAVGGMCNWTSDNACIE